MLQLKDVKKIYTTKAGEVHALNGVSITFPSTGLIFITGKSGCGKTTLLNVIGGLDGIDEGKIYIQDKEFSTFTAQEYDSYRNTFVGFVFQEYNLLSEFSVEYNIKIAMELQGREMDEDELVKLMKEVEIDGLRNRKPSELSGGQRQRVAIARALVKQPRIIMADEPTGALDGATGVQVLETLKKLSKNKLIIVVSHDNEFAEKYADRIIHLVDGQVVEDITFDEKEMDANLNEKEDSLIVKEGADLSENEKDILAKAVKDRKKIEFTEKFCFRDKKKTGEVEKDCSEPVALKKSKMKLKSSAQIGIKSLVVKPIRLIITIIISALAFAVFGLFDTIANFSTQSVLKNHVKENASTIVADVDYIVNKEADDVYNMKISEEAVARLESETNGKVKGIFDFEDTMLGRDNYTQAIEELRSSKVVVGRSYYTREINGFIEFDRETEIDADGNFKDFDYRIIAGRYPKIITDQGEKTEEESLREIAISKHLAESMVYFLNGNPLGTKEIHAPEDLCYSEITIGIMELKIVGIIDCGTIPEKYDSIKSVNPYNVSSSSLISDYNSFLDSGAHKCLFVAEGFREKINQKDASADVCYVGNTDSVIQIEMAGETDRLKLAQYVYSARDYDQNNILLFSGEYPSNGKVQLKDDEVLIHPLNFERIYKKALSDLEDPDKEREVMDKIRDIQYLPPDESAETFQSICDTLGIHINSGYIPVKLEQKSSKTENSLSKEIKIVGLYFGIEFNSYTIGTVFKLMVNDNLMREMNIYPDQGDYSKVLFSKESVKNGADAIVDYFVKDNGFALTWYNNSVLSVISENETMIKQAADLFLYVALALAVFSIFMLYNYISTSIANKQRSVGVLRGLGAGGKDILLIFLTESLVIGIINGILANLLSVLGCFLVNSYIMNEMSIFVSFALFGVRQLLMISGLSLLTAVLASALPIIKISKKKPVDLIRRA